jgi:hypothetical protein
MQLFFQEVFLFVKKYNSVDVAKGIARRAVSLSFRAVQVGGVGGLAGKCKTKKSNFFWLKRV